MRVANHLTGCKSDHGAGIEVVLGEPVVDDTAFCLLQKERIEAQYGLPRDVLGGLCGVDKADKGVHCFQSAEVIVLGYGVDLAHGLFGYLTIYCLKICLLCVCGAKVMLFFDTCKCAVRKNGIGVIVSVIRVVAVLFSYCSPIVLR